MSSFFPFTSSASSSSHLPGGGFIVDSDDPHLEVRVIPSASAFFAGETFSAKIIFRNTRPAVATQHGYSGHDRGQADVDTGTTAALVAQSAVTGLKTTHGPASHGLWSRPKRRGQIGKKISTLDPAVTILEGGSGADANGSAEHGSSRAHPPPHLQLNLAQTSSSGGGILNRGIPSPYSPGAPSSRAGWSATAAASSSATTLDGVVIRSPDAWRKKEFVVGSGPDSDRSGPGGSGHTRKSKSWALGNKGISPQEMVWALEGSQAGPPPLPSRRPPSGSNIPASHPHSRKISITSNIASPPDPSSPISSPHPDLPSIPESHSRDNLAASLLPEAGPSRPSSRTTQSSSRPTSATGSTSRSQLDLPNIDTPRSSGEMTAPRPRHPPTRRLQHDRAPSYHNAYGASLVGIAAAAAETSAMQTTTPPPPVHPSISSRPPIESRGTTTILWAYTRLVAQFHPSNHYIPPDPLLPLRSLLLHQPVGSGTLASPTSGFSSSSSSYAPSSSNGSGSGAKSPTSPSRWQLSFGTGTIGHSTQPSLTGSLFGLAKDLVSGGSSGSLEEERKRVWNMKDLPVLETTRSLLSVDVKLREGESKQFTYTLKLPGELPPTHRGRAFRFSYDLVISLTVALPGQGKRQKAKEILVPIRVWANVSVDRPLPIYDVLKPVIQTRETGKVSETAPSQAESINFGGAPGLDRSADDLMGDHSQEKPNNPIEADNLASLEAYANRLLKEADLRSPPPDDSPLSPPDSLITGPAFLSSTSLPTQAGQTTPLSPSMASATLNAASAASGVKRTLSRSKSNSSVRIREEDLISENGSEVSKCGEAVEILSRHSPKRSYDIAKDGEPVAVLTLVKQAYRLGETVLGVVTFNDALTERRVLKFSAYLESHEIIPESLLPFSANSSGRAKQPHLARLHAEHRSAYTPNTSRMAFSLDIPSDATPGFGITGGQEGYNGGVEWRLRLAFLVASPSTSARRRAAGIEKTGRQRPSHDDAGRASGLGRRPPLPLVEDTGRERQRQANGTHSPSEDERKKHHNHDVHHRRQGSNQSFLIEATVPESVHLLPLTGNASDGDNELYAASTSLAPLLPLTERRQIQKRDLPSDNRSDRNRGGNEGNRVENQEVKGIASPTERERKAASANDKVEMEVVQIGWEEMQCEVIECEIPVKVLAGNTAFVVRPSIHVV